MIPSYNRFMLDSPTTSPQVPESGLTPRNELRIATALTVITALGLVAAIILQATGAAGALIGTALVVSYLAGALRPGVTALRELREGQFDIDLLMVTAALAAAAVGEARDGAFLLVLFNLAGLLEDIAMNRTRQAVTALLELRPDEATMLVDGRERLVATAELRPGDIVLVRPGERIPIDGTLLEGFSSVDESSMTGESLPVDKQPGSGVLAGTMNTTGALVIRTDRHSSDTTLARMIRLVTEAQEQKSPSQRFGDWFGQRYAISVLIGSAVFLFIFYLTGLSWSDAMYRAATLLVVASPCAIVISVPAATLSAIAASARRGLLFKGAAGLEDLGSVSAVMFDKTGTLTTGRPAVEEVVSLGVSETELLEAATGLEARSEHPLAEGIMKYGAEQGIEPLPFTDVVALPGSGLRASLDGVDYWAGNERVPAELGVGITTQVTSELKRLQQLGMTAIIVGRGETVLGLIGMADQLRPEAPAFISGLKEVGIERLVMLTGDAEPVALQLAAELGLDQRDVHAGLLPEDKVSRIQALRQEHKVAYIGDGINDAPAVATADVGFAMGGIGSDAAMEAADAVVVADDLRMLPMAFRISEQTNRVLRQNLYFATGIMIVMVIFTLLGRLPLPLGVLGHEGGTLLVVANGLRLLGAGRGTRQ